MNTHKELSDKWKKLIDQYERELTHEDDLSSIYRTVPTSVQTRQDIDAFVFWLISRAHE